ncbi:hypothetical protein B0T17DRAFT_503583 [Bombardia bombarda]|uniref:Uncharacterized protein n=1 Tax=Bombardia bombarda TaxID=252184 RepID=A0AA39XL94_9PEZI|nr:hypothetical protein B0T17DRAFT_503583 [Bombardia bombarda]
MMFRPPAPIQNANDSPLPSRITGWRYLVGFFNPDANNIHDDGYLQDNAGDTSTCRVFTDVNVFANNLEYILYNPATREQITGDLVYLWPSLLLGSAATWWHPVHSSPYTKYQTHSSTKQSTNMCILVHFLCPTCQLTTDLMHRYVCPRKPCVGAIGLQISPVEEEEHVYRCTISGCPLDSEYCIDMEENLMNHQSAQQRGLLKYGQVQLDVRASEPARSHSFPPQFHNENDARVSTHEPMQSIKNDDSEDSGRDDNIQTNQNNTNQDEADNDSFTPHHQQSLPPLTGTQRAMIEKLQEAFRRTHKISLKNGCRWAEEEIKIMKILRNDAGWRVIDIFSIRAVYEKDEDGQLVIGGFRV